MASVSVENVRNLQVLIKADDHEWIGDEPPDVGDGVGPSPYDMLLGALGSCMTMTLMLYARRKEWALERVHVDIKHDRIHADDAENVEEADGLVDRFQIDMILHGDLDESQRERLAEISTRCPIRKTLGATHVFEETVQLSS